MQQESEEFFPLPLKGTITIGNSDGSIHIFGWYEPRVRLGISRKAYTAARLREIKVETEAGPSALTIRTVIPKASGFLTDRSGTVDYTLNVPEPARLKLRLTNGEITLQGLRGARADLELVNGRITALNCFAEVRARSQNGVMEAFFEWWENLPATFDYALQHGRIGVRLPAEARFRVEARTSNGRIHQDFRLPAAQEVGPGQVLQGATAAEATMSLGLSTGGGNISLDRSR